MDKTDFSSKRNVITVGFTTNEAILLSPLFRRLYPARFICTCTELMNLKHIIEQDNDAIIICSGSMDFLELDAACLLAKQAGTQVSACIFTEAVKNATLALAEQHDIPVVLANLETEEELGECARAIQEHRRYKSKRLVHYKAPRCTSFDEYFNLLTIKERIACLGMLQGYKHDIIASMLGVKKTTADTYCSKVLSKFNAKSIAQLFQYFAFRNI